jgi:dolichol-phosphate mannosyltransferase
LNNSDSTLVFIPTYNEAGNIEKMVERVFEALPGCQLLIVDDGSPDGTSDVVRRLQKDLKMGSNLLLEERPGKLGIGSAHRLAMMRAVQEGFGFLITMDGDGSHNPAYLPSIQQNLKDHDFVIGSRFLPESKLDYEGWRRVVSVNANRFLSFLVQPEATEFTTALRGFRVDWLENFPLHHMAGQGYSFFFRCVIWTYKLGARVKEIPIHFLDRDSGKSKVNLKEVFLGVTNVFRIIIAHWAGRNLPTDPAPDHHCDHCQKTFITLEGDQKICLACGQAT